ncbi:TPA: hypothetical protein BOS_803 [Bos taurus]|nr:TPA: hypothetical protein BOS_803 [Bos taurus]
MSELKSHSPDHQSELINKSPSNPSLHLEEAWGTSAPSVRPAAGSRSCGGERSHSGSGRRAAGACSVRVARAGRTQGETEGTSGALFLERERRGRAGARGEHRLDRGGDMRTYWLHSVWVLGFFLSLFSLQGK